MGTLDLVWARREHRRRVTEYNRAETILRDLPHVVFHLRDAFYLPTDELSIDIAYSRVNRRADILTLATTIRRIDTATIEWHLVVARCQRFRGTPLPLANGEGRSWALALFGTQHAASVTGGATLPPEELPSEFHSGMHYAVRVRHDARPMSADAVRQ